MANVALTGTAGYAQAGSPGVFADQIGWISYDLPDGQNFEYYPGTIYNVTNTLSRPGNYTIKFNLQIQNGGGNLIPLAPYETPIYDIASFGITTYLGIPGKIAIYMTENASTLTATFITMTNITITDEFGIPVTNYDIIVSDAETTNSYEFWSAFTNGTPWSILQIVPPIDPNNPQVSIAGIGTDTITYSGYNYNTAPSITLSSKSPRTIASSLNTYSGKQGVIFGVMIPSTTYNDEYGGISDCC